MTVNELNEFMYEHGFCNTNNNEDLPKKYVADLVEFALRDGRAKAIDEFAKKLKLELDKRFSFGINNKFNLFNVIDEIAEQLKAGE